MEHHLTRVMAKLHDAGLRAAVLKGPAVAARYRNPAHRSFGDLDILVPPSDLDRALRLLEEDESVMKVPPKGPKADKRDILLKDGPSGVRFNIDLHWDLFSYTQFRGTARGATQAAWEEAVEQPDAVWGPHWNLPEPYRIAFLAAHAFLDHRFRLILFRDFLELTRGGDVEWDRLEQVASRWGLRSTTFLSLWMARDVLEASVPHEFLAAVRPRSFPVRFLSWSLPRIDLVRFDGHRPHPINLAAVLLNDSSAKRLSLLIRAPAAFPGWKRRVASHESSGDRPRTLIVVSTDRRRGAEVFTERLRGGLSERGWVVEALALRGVEDEPRADLEALVRTGGRHIPRFEWRLVAALRSKIKTFQPDVVVANGGATLRYGLAATLGLRCRLAYVGIGEPRYWIRSRVSRWANRLMLRKVDQVLAVSEVTRRQLLELEPKLAGRVHTTYTGVPANLFTREHQMAPGPLRLLMVGSLTAEKDPFRALEAVAAVDGARLRFVGDGPLAQELMGHVQRLDAADRVEFAGSVMDVEPHLDWAHVLLLTSRSEGLPGAVLEAGAMGVPAVAVDVGGVREAIVDGETGIVVTDPDHLADAVRSLDDDRERLAQMGKAARQNIAARFSLRAVIDGYAMHLIELGK